MFINSDLRFAINYVFPIILSFAKVTGIAARQAHHHQSYSYALNFSAIPICVKLSYPSVLKINEFVRQATENKKRMKVQDYNKSSFTKSNKR